MLDTVFLGVGFIIGSGIFLFPILMASVAGTYSLIAWVVGGAYTILSGLCFAENAARKPKAGGLYTYAHDAFGDTVGFIAGWAFWVGYWVTIATETVAISLYLKFFLPEIPDLSRVLIATITALILTFVNYRGVKFGGKLGDAFTVGKLVPLLVFVLFGIFLLNFKNYYPLLPPDTSVLPAVGAATIFALWAYLGVEIITVPDEEIKDAKRTVPRAVVISVVTVLVIYLLVAFVALGLGRWEDFTNSKVPLADLFQAATQKYMGNAGGILLAAGGLIAIVGFLNAVILGTARISYAMARDKLFPKFFDHLHPKCKTPDRAILIQTILAVVLIFALTNLSALASLAVLFTVVPYLLSCLATLKVVRDANWKTKVLHTRWIPVAAVLASLALLFYFGISTLILGAIFLLIGLGIYSVGRRTWIKDHSRMHG